MIYLASQSPRRQELLNQAKIPFILMSVENESLENILPNENPKDYVQRVCLNKANYANTLVKELDYPILTADTTVALDNNILGKAIHRQNAYEMLKMLGGREHIVYTAICLINKNIILKDLSTSIVKFKTLSDREIQQYLDTNEYIGKAGSYGIQGMASIFVEYIKGSYTGIVGLPLFETNKLINQYYAK